MNAKKKWAASWALLALYTRTEFLSSSADPGIFVNGNDGLAETWSLALDAPLALADLMPVEEKEAMRGRHHDTNNYGSNVESGTGYGDDGKLWAIRITPVEAILHVRVTVGSLSGSASETSMPIATLEGKKKALEVVITDCE
jgi:hypothetical protein